MFGSMKVVGLVQSGVLGLATIARGMVDGADVRHRIKRVWRFCRGKGVSTEKVTEALAAWAVHDATPFLLRWVPTVRRRAALIATLAE